MTPQYEKLTQTVKYVKDNFFFKVRDLCEKPFRLSVQIKPLLGMRYTITRVDKKKLFFSTLHRFTIIFHYKLKSDKIILMHLEI